VLAFHVVLWENLVAG